MIQLVTFQQMSVDTYDDAVLQDAIREINTEIKKSATDFRIVIEFLSTSIESRLYKNAIAQYFISSGFKIVIYPSLIYIDWGKVNVSQRLHNYGVSKISQLGEYFRAEDLYLILTNNVDLRSISYRIMLYRVKEEIKKMNSSGVEVALISFDKSTTMLGTNLNKMFAPEINRLNQEIPNTLFSFVDGGLLKITLNSFPEEYTDISPEILFGTRKPLV